MNTTRLDNKAVETDKDMFKVLINRFSCLPLVPNTTRPSVSKWTGWSFKQNKVIAMGDSFNLGIVTGPASGVMVLSVVNPELFFSVCKKEGWDWKDNQVVQTLNGFHIYFRYDVSLENYFKVARITSAIREIGVELLLNKSYAVAPGSVVDGHKVMVHHDGEISTKLPAFVMKAFIETKVR